MFSIVQLTSLKYTQKRKENRGKYMTQKTSKERNTLENATFFPHSLEPRLHRRMDMNHLNSGCFLATRWQQSVDVVLRLVLFDLITCVFVALSIGKYIFVHHVYGWDVLLLFSFHLLLSER